MLSENEPEEIVATVLQMWGETPTIETPELPELPEAPGTDETPEETTAEIFWDEMAAAIEEGVNEV